MCLNIIKYLMVSYRIVPYRIYLCTLRITRQYVVVFTTVYNIILRHGGFKNFAKSHDSRTKR